MNKKISTISSEFNLNTLKNYPTFGDNMYEHVICYLKFASLSTGFAKKMFQKLDVKSVKFSPLFIYSLVEKYFIGNKTLHSPHLKREYTSTNNEH